MAKTKTRADVLVLGAGVSGLGAARALADGGRDVIVLEARDRVGGRVWSNRTWPGLSLDMGAGWLEGDEGNPLTELVERERIRTVVYDEDSDHLYRADGTEVDDDAWEALSDRHDEVMAQVEALRAERQRRREPDISLQEGVEQVLRKKKYSPEELRELDYSITTTVESDYADDSSRLSCYHWDNGDGFDGDDLIFPGGYDQIPRALARGLDVRLEHVVQRVEYGDHGVRVITSQGTFEADHAVVAVPLGVLKKGSIAFDPPLPARKREAIEKLGMGLLNRVYLRFPRAFWPAEAHGFGIIPRRRDEWTEYVNFLPFVGQPILLCFNSGDFARKVEALSDKDTVDGMMKTLRGVFGDDIPEPTASLITRWSRDPFAGGSYSCQLVGSTPQHILDLAAPVGPLFFAGEATEPEYAATVHGALIAGRRAAEEIEESEESDEDDEDDDEDDDDEDDEDDDEDDDDEDDEDDDEDDEDDDEDDGEDEDEDEDDEG